jgi:hypothetical protein
VLPTKFPFIWPSSFREDLKKSPNQKQELPVVAMFANGSGRNVQFYRGPSIDASYQISVHLAKQFQRRFLAWPNERKFGGKHLWKVLY